MYIHNFNDNMSGVPILNVDMSSTTSSSVDIVPTQTATNTTNLTVGVNTATPLTPEILNSVMAMTNPLEYSFPSNTTSNPSTSKVSQTADSHSSSSGSPFDSPLATTPAGTQSIVKEATTPTVQQTCSQLIKTSLKLSLEMKRKMSTSDTSSVDTAICKKIKQDIDSSEDEMIMMKPSRSMANLSPEDEDRRRRRRERNKIAATKCRMKKRERTVNLVSEAETLETQNIDLKAQVRSLEIERRSLTEMLQLHGNSCTRGVGFQIPNINANIMKYLNDIGLANPSQNETITTTNNVVTVKSEPARTRNTSIKTTQKIQKIPSVNTLRFNTRSSQQENKSHQITNVLSPVTTSRNCMIGALSNTSPIQDCKPLPSIDMGFCDGHNDSLTPTNSYCKSLISSSSDCYAISSPDSGFIKSPVDMASYSTLPQMIKSDYIPNCDTGILNDSGNPNRSIEFILKSELVDTNESPYTNINSADRFLFDGVDTFDSELDTGGNSNNQPLIDAQSHMHDGLKEHLLVQGMNNNNNSSHINNNHHHHTNLDPNTNQNMVHNFGTVPNLPVISSVLPPPHSTSIIEFNTCQQFIDSSLLKGDFLSQNCDFLDSQFTTDLDSGVTTYTNSSGCLA